MPSSKSLPPAYLEAEVGGENRRYPLAGGHTFQIGRSDRNHVVLPDDLASRHHAMLQRSDQGQFYITDLGSSNGTFVNGVRISAPLILRPGDRVSIGNHELCFYQETDMDVELPPAEDTDELKSTNMLIRESLITVLVVDIRDFTGLAQRIDNSKLSMLTGSFFREAGKALQERGAWAQKYIGDAVMAVWLHKKREPELQEMLAVFDGLLQVATIAAGLQSQFELNAPILVGAGINTGRASIGNVGSIASSDYTALGDVVNKTFRLESATRELPCDLMIGEGTFDFLASLQDVLPLFECCTVKLKGYDEPATAYGSRLESLPELLEVFNRIQDTDV